MRLLGVYFAVIHLLYFNPGEQKKLNKKITHPKMGSFSSFWFKRSKNPSKIIKEFKVILAKFHKIFIYLNWFLRSLFESKY